MERAQALYAKNLKDSDNALRLNLITQEQYNSQMAAFAARRDELIAKANSTANADARTASQLKAVLSAYDPVIRATETYAATQNILRQAYDSGNISISQYVKALNEQKRALDAVKSSQTGSTEFQAKQYQATLDRLIPVNAQLRSLNEAEQILLRTRAQGKVSTEAQIKDYERATAAIAAERVEIERRSQAERRGNSAKQDAAALRGLPAQFTDIVVSLQGGQAPLTVLLQQGGQLKDMFGGIVPMFKAVGGAIAAMITPLTVTAAALTTFGVAMIMAASESNEFNKAMAASANYSGVTSNAFLNMQQKIYGVTGVAGQAAQAMTLLQASGKVTAENFEAITVAAIKLQRVAGMAIKDTVAEFVSLGKDPASAVVTLNEKYNFLTSAVYAQIVALQKQGDIAGAVSLAQAEMARGAEEMADRIKPALGVLETGWQAIRDGAKGAWDAMLNIGRENSLDEKLADVQKRIATYNDGFLAKMRPGTMENSPMLRILAQEQEGLIKSIAARDKAVASESEMTRAKREAVAAQQALNSSYETNRGQVKTLESEIARTKRYYGVLQNEAKLNGTVISKIQEDQYKITLEGLDKRLKDAKEQAARVGGGGATPIDSRDVQEVKSNLNVITSEYDAAYKKITALGAANVVSQEATFASQSALLASQKEAVISSYDEQIAAIKKLQGVKGNTASQSINLDNQLTRAEDARLKSMQDMDAKMEVLAIAEKGRLQKRTEAIEAYNDALRSQIDNTKTAGERAVSAVGQGDRQTTLNANLADVDRQFAKDQASLAKQFSKGMDPVEYAANLKNLTEAHNEMTAQILQNDANIQAANADWTNGFTKAIQNLADEANNMAGAVNTAVSGAFSSMGDAMGEFVTTGKLDFKSLASSILSDMAKIAARAATNAALSSLFGAFTGGTTSAISGFSETLSTPYAQAKGGGWTGGTQFFAQGGAFTNSIVSSPTAFGMSGGGRGVMGEAGPEAIMPLARASDGSLGVRMVGAGGMQTTGGVNVYVTINSDGSVNAETDKAGTEQFGKEIGTIIESKYRLLLASDLKDGGAIKNAIKAG